MKIIPLTRGLVALVSDEDFEKVSCFKWFAERTRPGFYASRNRRVGEGKKGLIRMHQMLLGIKGSVLEGHHKDGFGLNNTRENLVPATRLENSRGHFRKRDGASSRFRGVTWVNHKKKWVSQIAVGKKRYFLGYFAVEEDAARARDKATLKHFGKDAQLNFTTPASTLDSTGDQHQENPPKSENLVGGY